MFASNFPWPFLSLQTELGAGEEQQLPQTRASHGSHVSAAAPKAAESPQNPQISWSKGCSWAEAAPDVIGFAPNGLKSDKPQIGASSVTKTTPQSGSIFIFTPLLSAGWRQLINLGSNKTPALKEWCCWVISVPNSSSPSKAGKSLWHSRFHYSTSDLPIGTCSKEIKEFLGCLSTDLLSNLLSRQCWWSGRRHQGEQRPNNPDWKAKKGFHLLFSINTANESAPYQNLSQKP